MSSKRITEITEFLCEESDINLESDDLTESKKEEVCFKKTLEALFDIKIDCKKFYDVINGEGNEKEKITTAYSSSLQSLLVFAGVSDNNPITIDGIPYTQSYFEYKNKVIGYPSSIDVVLVGKDKNNEITVLFIESKLYEIIRDSCDKQQCNDTKKCAVVRPSYFSNNPNGYKEKLKIPYERLKNLGFDLTGICESDYGNKPKSDIKKAINEYENNASAGQRKIAPFNNNKYVYSEGIRQLFSHIIGILNFEKPDKNCSDYLYKSLKGESFKKKYISLYNELPGHTENDATEKFNNFKTHQEAVMEELRKTVKDIDMSVKSYQDIYKNAYEKNKKYFDNIKKVVDYYKLDEKPT